MRSCGEYGVAVALRTRIEDESFRCLVQRPHRRSQLHRAAMVAHECGGRLGKQFTQVCPRDEKIARFARAIQAIAHHVQEGLRRGRRGRGIECGHAQWLPQIASEGSGLPVPRKQYGDRHVGGDAIARAAHSLDEAYCRQALAPGQSGGAQQGFSKMQGSGKTRHAQAELARIFDGERQAREQPVRVGADCAHQAQGFAVGPDQNVLAVVECHALDFDRARAAARVPRRLEYHDRDLCLREYHSGSHAGPAGADDSDVHVVIQIFHAIHSLRTGVKAVRWLSTLQPSSAISLSSVR